ncbi:membrane protein [Mycobacterium phage Sejanus]|nr:membrane protein [Mycobacterium phage Sejanus]
MTRALWFAAWVFAVIAWMALIMLWREVLVVAGIASAVATLGWSYLTYPDCEPDSDDWATDEWWTETEPKESR